MPENLFKAAARAAFRRYLSRFPLRDGKAYFYEKFQGRLLPEERLLSVTLDPGFKMRLDLADAEQRKVYFFGHYHERYEAALVAALLDPGEVFWDVGANVGYFALVAARAVGGTGEVLAFEPGTAALARLEENVALNPFPQIRIFPWAVAEADGEAVLYRAEGIADSSASLFAAAAGAARGEVCRTTALDSLLRRENLRPPDFIKLDVEGAELAALRGGAAILGDYRPLLLVEMEERNLQAAGTSRAAIQAFLQGFGYRPAHLRKGRWLPLADVTQTRGRNIFWFDPENRKHRERSRRVLSF